MANSTGKKRGTRKPVGGKKRISLYVTRKMKEVIEEDQEIFGFPESTLIILYLLDLIRLRRILRQGGKLWCEKQGEPPISVELAGFRTLET